MLGADAHAVAEAEGAVGAVVNLRIPHAQIPAGVGADAQHAAAVEGAVLDGNAIAVHEVEHAARTLAGVLGVAGGEIGEAELAAVFKADAKRMSSCVFAETSTLNVVLSSLASTNTL